MKHSRLSVSVLTRLVVLTVLGGRLLAVPLAQAAPAFTLFESGHVRPLALSPNRSKLFAVNTPDNRLEVSAVEQPGSHAPCLGRRGPRARRGRRPRTNSEVWVVNHLSDSVSIVSVGRDHCPCHAHAAGRRRAARHRLRRTAASPGRSSRPRTAGRTRPLSHSSRRLGSAAPTSGCSTPPTSDEPRGHAADDHQPVQRHAASARGDARRQRGVCRGVRLGQPDHDRPDSARSPIPAR